MVKRRTGRNGPNKPRDAGDNVVPMTVPATATEAAEPNFAVSHPEIHTEAEATADEMLLQSVSPAAISETFGSEHPEAESVPEAHSEPAIAEPEIDVAPQAAAISEAAHDAVREPAFSAPVAVRQIEDATESAATVVPVIAGARRTISLAAQPLDIVDLNVTLMSFLRSETAAALAHVQSLGGAKSPADAIRLQVSEMQRLADASLTCWTTLARKASRFMEIRRS